MIHESLPSYAKRTSALSSYQQLPSGHHVHAALSHSCTPEGLPGAQSCALHLSIVRCDLCLRPEGSIGVSVIRTFPLWTNATWQAPSSLAEVPPCRLSHPRLWELSSSSISRFLSSFSSTAAVLLVPRTRATATAACGQRTFRAPMPGLGCSRRT